MKLLLDTHALIWWLTDNNALTRRADEAIADEDNTVFVSAASAMEIATKFRIGKLPNAAMLAQDFEAVIAAQGFAELPITVRHARVAGEIRIDHRDPFDRFLIAQANLEGMVLVSNEKLFDAALVQRLW